MFSVGMLDSNTWKQWQPNLKAVYSDSLAFFLFSFVCKMLHCGGEASDMDTGIANFQGKATVLYLPKSELVTS